jgi:hypothetical protein
MSNLYGIFIKKKDLDEAERIFIKNAFNMLNVDFCITRELSEDLFRQCMTELATEVVLEEDKQDNGS